MLAEATPTQPRQLSFEIVSSLYRHHHTALDNLAQFLSGFRSETRERKQFRMLESTYCPACNRSATLAFASDNSDLWMEAHLLRRLQRLPKVCESIPYKNSRQRKKQKMHPHCRFWADWHSRQRCMGEEFVSSFRALSHRSEWREGALNEETDGHHPASPDELTRMTRPVTPLWSAKSAIVSNNNNTPNIRTETR